MIPRDDTEQVVTTACPNCGSENIETRVQVDEIQQPAYAGRPAATISVSVPARTCRDCSFAFLDGEAEALYHEAVCRHLGILLPDDIRSIRERHGLSRDDFAELTKLGRATVSRWERGCLIQNASHDQFLYLLMFDENIERLRTRKTSSLPDPMQSSPVPRGRPGAFRAVRLSREIIAQADAFRLIPEMS